MLLRHDFLQHEHCVNVDCRQVKKTRSEQTLRCHCANSFCYLDLVQASVGSHAHDSTPECGLESLDGLMAVAKPLVPMSPTGRSVDPVSPGGRKLDPQPYYQWLFQRRRSGESGSPLATHFPPQPWPPSPSPMGRTASEWSSALVAFPRCVLLRLKGLGKGGPLRSIEAPADLHMGQPSPTGVGCMARKKSPDIQGVCQQSDASGRCFSPRSPMQPLSWLEAYTCSR